MRITTPAAQLAAQSASTCSAYKRASSYIWQCVLKFFGSASSTRVGGVVGVGVACRRAKEAAKKFYVVANFSAYFAHKTEAAFHLPPLLCLFIFVCYFFFLLFCLLPSCLASFWFSFQLQVPRFFSFKCFNRNLSNWKIKGLQRRRQKFLLVLPKRVERGSRWGGD